VKTGFWNALVAVLVALVVGCNAAPAPSATSIANADKPSIVIQSPADGAQLPLGQDVSVSGAASDGMGVDHVELFVDGVSAGSTPAGQSATLVPFTINWLAAPSGPHTLQAVAYRQDGTASDPASVSVTVGTSASTAPSSPSSLATPTPVSIPSPTGTPTPTKTPAPKPSKTPRPTRSPTPAPTPPPEVTPDPSGNAPDDIDNEPYEIVLMPNNDACPPIETGVPVTASGCIWEQISAPAGDTSDDLEFTQNPNTTYHLRLTWCSDTSDATLWSLFEPDESSATGCMDSMNRTSSGGNPGSLPFSVFFGPVAAQTYNVYQFTVYECQFAGCKSH
jgi:hypothetical protein